MTSNSFWHNNKAYIYTALGLAVVGFVFIKYLMIMDWGYLIQFTLHALIGDTSGVVGEPKTLLEQMMNAAFGPSYNTIAPEIIRASNERQEYIWYVFVAEIVIFAFLYIKNGRVEANITRPDDMVTVFTPFQRAVIWLNIGLICILILTGFNITWSLRSEGGTLPRILRQFHEIAGLTWANNKIQEAQKEFNEMVQEIGIPSGVQFSIEHDGTVVFTDIPDMTDLIERANEINAIPIEEVEAVINKKKG